MTMKVIAVVLLLTAAAYSEDLMTASQLLPGCKTAQRFNRDTGFASVTEASQASLCIGYVSGMMDATDLAIDVPTPVRGVIDLFVDACEKWPQLQSKSAAVVIAVALVNSKRAHLTR